MKMKKPDFFIFFLILFISSQTLAAPLEKRQAFSKPLLGGSFCSGLDLLDYKSGQEYIYEYQTDTALWINDVSEESKSNMVLKTTAIVSRLAECKFLLRLEGSSLTGESIDSDANLIQHLNDHVAVFEFNSEGEIHSEINFATSDLAWSRNIKRGIISAFQIRSEKNLRKLDQLNDTNEKSSVVYETDVLGRCRTTYELDNGDYQSGKSLRLIKRKSLHACTSNIAIETFSSQIPYRTRPEFVKGRYFIEKFECRSFVKDNILNEIKCDELSTFSVSSKGLKGVQVVLSQSLKLKSVNPAMSRVNYVPESFDKQSILYEFSDSNLDDSEFKNFDANSFLDSICKNVETEGLSNDHSSDFKKLSNNLKSKTTDELVALYDSAKSKCDMAGIALAEAIIYANTESSLNAALNLLDKDAFKGLLLPQLTFLARLKNPSVALINKLNDYLTAKGESFPYLKKMYLIYSTLVSTYCRKNDCSAADLKKWSALFGQNLGSNCADSSKKDLVTVSLKAIGNIGSFENAKVLSACASNQENSNQVRLSAVESFRRFPCNTFLDHSNGASLVWENREDDTELRISAFTILTKCQEIWKDSPNAATYMINFLEQEKDYQLLTYVIDYAKEHGLTGLLNPILSSPKIREQFSVNFKELSWNRYRYRYSLERDGGLEAETSMIYTSNSAVPRSIRFNITGHMFGGSTNIADVTLRLEGVSDYLKGRLLDKLSTEDIIKKLMDKPEKLIEILQIVVAQLKFVAEKPFVSLSIRKYNSEVLYAELKDMEDLKKFAELLRSPRNNLYRKVEYIKSASVIDRRLRKSLPNGLEVNTFIEISAGVYVNKDSSKTDTENKREFDINNFYSLSASVNRKFQVLLNKDNRLSLKKNAFLNGKVKLDLTGSKESEDKSRKVSYSLDLSPSDRTLLVIDGKFFKLGKNSQYKEVKEFTVEQYKYEKCTSDKFSAAFGIEACLKFNRPLVGSLFDSFKPIDVDQILADEAEDDNEEDDDDEKVNDLAKRPRFSLSGPYRYEIKYKNPQKTKSITLDLEREKDHDEGTYDVKAEIGTVSQSGDEKNTLELVYERKRTNTNRAFDRTASLELRVPSTKEIRFKLLGEAIYKKNELFQINFAIENKILKQLTITGLVLREKEADNVIPTYKLEAEYNSDITDMKGHLKLNIIPAGRDIKTVLSLETNRKKSTDQPMRIIDIEGMLTHKKSEEDIDYKVDYTYKSFRKTTASLTGDVTLSMFKSNLDLNFIFSSLNLKLDSPANVKIGHAYDGSKGGKSFINLGLTLPSTKVNHNVKVIVGLDGFSLDSVEFQVKTPSSLDKPLIVSLAKSNSKNDDADVTEIQLLFNNFNIDLSTRKSAVAQALIKVDEDNILRSLLLKLRREKSQDGKRNDARLELEKNNKAMASFGLNTNLKLDLAKLATNPKEIPRQEASAAFDMKVLDYTGSMQGSLNLEKSAEKNSHSGEFEFKTDSILKFLTKVSNLNVKFDKKGDAFKANLELVRLGDLRTLKLASTSGIRKNGDMNEFDISYEKNMANGDKNSAKGLVKFSIKDYFNSHLTINVEKAYRLNFHIQNENGKRMLHFNRAHLDFFPVEGDYKITSERKTEGDLSYLDASVNARRGEPNALSDTDKLEIYANANLKNVRSISAEKCVSREIEAKIKVKSFKVDLDLKTNRKFDLATQIGSLKVASNHKFPNFRKSGEIIDFKDNLDLTTSVNSEFKSLNKQFKAKYQVEALGKVANLDFTREITKGNVNYNFNAVINKVNNFNVRLIADMASYGMKTFEMGVKQDLVKTYESRLLKKELGVLDCVVKSSFERVKDKTSGKYLLDTSMSAKCDNKVIGDFSILIDRAYPKDLETWSPFSFQTSKIRWSHERFEVGRRYLELTLDKTDIKKKGLAEIKAELGEFKLSNLISYSREVDPTSEKLTKGSYKLETNVGAKAKKTCDLKIENDGPTHFSTLNCKVTTSLFPETSYGFGLKREGIDEKTSGKKNIELDVNIPGRTIRVEYARSKELVDLNDGREYEATAKVYLDYAKDKERCATIKFKRDQIAQGHTKFNLFVSRTPVQTLKQVGLEVERKRSFNQTSLNLELNYETASGKKNSLKSAIILASNFVSNSISSELSLARPDVNIMYENKFNKNDGKLQNLGVRLGRLLKLSVEKEDPENRRISIEFANPDPSKYAVDSDESLDKGVFTVRSSLKSSGGDLLSTLKSTFDSNDNSFVVIINPVKANANKEYIFNFGLFNESLANAVVAETVKDSKTILGTASLKIVKDNEHKDLVLNLKWNRLWGKIKADILNEPSSTFNEKFNSYFGDVYGVLSDDLKPAIDNIRNTRKSVRGDFKKLGMALADFYATIAPGLKEKFLMQPKNIEPEEEDVPLYKRAFAAYNRLAKSLEGLSLKIRSKSKRLSRLIPRLPVLTYNPDRLTKNIAPFSNDLEVRRPTLNAHNLYQFNAEYRDYLRRLGEKVLNFKNTMIRNLAGYGIKGLINKYKFRSLSSYTIVGSVFNKRNVIFFNGESTTLKASCKYLLAHELRKNQFSVILNQNDSPNVISVSAYGKDLIDITYDKASINNKELNLPYSSENDKVKVIRTYSGVCVNVNNDLEVCCNKESKSCTVALTRWHTGRVNGLLGRTNYKRDALEEEAWFLDASCKAQKLKMKEPSDAAVNTCHSIFGKHRKSVFRSALTVLDAVNDGWKDLCESVMTANPAAKCDLMKAFANHARVKSIDLDVPNECFQCIVDKKSYKVGESLPKKEGPVAINDWVFVMLPCEKSKYSLEKLTEIQNQFQAKYPDNRQYFIRVKGSDASLVQTDSSKMVNLDYKQAFSLNLKTEKVDEEGLYKAFFMAGQIFADSGRISSRQIVIVSCGNCMQSSLTGLKSRKLEKLLSKQNVIVSSWGEYDLKDNESDSDEEIPIGYANDHVVLYKKEDKSIDVDELASYKIEHKSDLCSRLASKTSGSLFNINYIREADINSQIISKLMKTFPVYQASQPKCVRVDTSFGDASDLSYKRTLVKINE